MPENKDIWTTFMCKSSRQRLIALHETVLAMEESQKMVTVFVHSEAAAMGEFKHLVIVKFKDGVSVDEILPGMKKLAMEIDAVKSFEWGKEMEGPEELRDGFTHVFSMNFNSKEDFSLFQSHPARLQFSATFFAAIEKILLLDFPPVLTKPPPFASN